MYWDQGSETYLWKAMRHVLSELGRNNNNRRYLKSLGCREGIYGVFQESPLSKAKGRPFLERGVGM